MTIPCPECNGIGAFAPGPYNAGADPLPCDRCDGTGRSEPTPDDPAALALELAYLLDRLAAWNVYTHASQMRHITQARDLAHRLNRALTEDPS